MSRWLVQVFCFVMLVFTLPITTLSQHTPIRYSGQGQLKIGYSSISYIGVGDSVQNLQQAQYFFKQGKFRLNTLPDLNLGIAKDNYWVHLSLTNNQDHPQRLFINLENPRLNDVHIFLLQDDSITSKFTLGDTFPFNYRLIYYNQFAFPVNLQSSDSVEVFMFINHKGNTLQIPIRVSNENNLLSYIEENYMATGIVSGVLLITFFFGIFFLINTRDPLFLYYSGYTLSAAFWVWSTEGFGFQFLYPNVPELATRIGPGMSVLALAFFLVTCLQFCKPYDRRSTLRSILFVMVSFLFVWGALPFMPFVPITQPGYMSTFLTIHFFINLICIILLIIYLTKLTLKGNYIVLYYFVAVALNLVFSFIIVARHSGWLNIPMSSGLFMSIGFVVEIIIMTAGITKQFYTYKKEKEETLLAYLDQQKSITNQVLQTQEAERNRISKELHDDIGPKLTQITLISEMLKNQTSTESKSLKELNLIAENSRQLVTNMGEIIWSLNPQNKSLQNLLGYLREQLNVLLEYSGIDYHINFESITTDRELNHSQLRTILLVTKEIVHNAIKYSQAKKINIECGLREGGISFNIIDDGKGFDLAKQTFGSGLRNIKGRIEEVGGSLTLETNPEMGTQFKYFLPF